VAPADALAACPGPEQVAERVAAYLARQPVQSYGPGLSVEDGYCGQQRYVEMLAERLGPPAGYKVGFTSKAMRERFGVAEPARGVLFRPMILADGAELPATFGVRPMVEADLAVTVKDDGVNDARTPLEALQHLDQVVPFIELPDLVVPQGQALDAGVIIALNVLPRHGVTGQGRAIQPTEAFLEALGSMEAVFTDDTGKELSRARGTSLLDNPANVVVWLAQNLKASGLRLKAGDLLSLGAMGALVPAEAGRTYTLRYEGLPGGPIQARVRIR
jgi:2-keto-4-pentenoate hydratase